MLFKCKCCGATLKGSYSRVKAHLLKKYWFMELKLVIR